MSVQSKAESGLLAALIELEDLVSEAGSLARTWVDLAGDSEGAPDWPSVVFAMVGRLDAALLAVSVKARELTGGVS